jgi:hypothetical protein
MNNSERESQRRVAPGSFGQRAIELRPFVEKIPGTKSSTFPKPGAISASVEAGRAVQQSKLKPNPIKARQK